MTVGVPLAAAVVCGALALPATVTSASPGGHAGPPRPSGSGAAPAATRRPQAAATAERLAVTVSGSRLLDGAGRVLQLRGVNRSGTQYMCVLGHGIFDGPDDAASIAAISSWHANAVRIPLNEDCWLGVNGAPAVYSGAPYRAAIGRYVAALNHAGIYVILDVHWSAPGTRPAVAQQPMLDASHGYTLWRSIARAFRRRRAVMFDLYNEPYRLGATPALAWRCWRVGCNGDAGMAGLVRTIRSVGAHNVILLAGLDWANDESGWLTHAPYDPAHQLAVAFHVYLGHGWCTDEPCWARRVVPLAARVPVIADEFGEMRCGEPQALRWLEDWMSFADAHGLSTLAWSWNTGGENCEPPRLISTYGGTSTPYGAAVKAFYTAARAGPPATPARAHHGHPRRR